VLSPWEGDPLSAFLADAQRNERVSALKVPDVYALLQRVHAAFEQVATITERENNPNLLPTRFLMVHARGAWLAAVRSVMSGQTVEAYPLVRAVIENAWYALHIAKDPAPPARTVVWLRRSDDDTALAQCKTEFRVRTVRDTHAALDADAEKALHTLYEWAIEPGGHPNERGVLAAMTRTQTGPAITFGPVLLANDPDLILVALKSAGEAAVGALKVFRLIFPERFAIMGLDGEIDALVGRLNAVFMSHARQGQGLVPGVGFFPA